MTYRKKLIEVALPLEAINIESAREKSIRHGHPSTLHLWWARRPLAACRAVLWASLVDDPSSWPEKFPTEEAQNKERQRLFDILGRIEIEKDKKGNTKQVVRGLVSWDEINKPNSPVLEEAQREIARCLAWQRGDEPPTKPDAIRDYIAKYAPPAYDPFCGGGSIPLEAQRLGLEAHGSDLNPVAVLITKALIEIPPKFRDKPPVNPDSGKQIRTWQGAQGLAEDVRYYGQWMRDEAFKKIGHLYPKVALTPDPLPEVALTPWPPLPEVALTPWPPLPEGEGELEDEMESDRKKWEITDSLHKRMIEIARQLRREQTKSEAILWGALRNRQLEGRKFRRQYPIGKFVVDFYCDSEGLVVEVDGAIHQQQEELDRQRQELLESLGLRFVRLKAEQVETNLANALETIRHQLLPPSNLGREARGEGKEATVIAWLWARTVKCPNPACGCQMPLVRSFQLSTKKGKEAWVEPVVERPHPSMGEKEQENKRNHSPRPLGEGPGVRVKFEVKTGKGGVPESPKTGRGATFQCLACGQPSGDKHIKAEGMAGRMDAQLMAIVAEGKSGRVYLSPNAEHEAIAKSAKPTWYPDAQISDDRRSMFTPLYGLTHFHHLFTPRQLVALTTFSDLVTEAREKIKADAVAAGMADDDLPLNDGGIGATAYADAVSTYLAFGVDRLADRNSTICSWDISRNSTRNTFARQAIPMTWDFAEANPMSDSTGNFNGAIDWVVEVIKNSTYYAQGLVKQHDATQPLPIVNNPIFSSDPPYGDNIGYADLSDFFYVWLRRSLNQIYSNICSTLLVPKTPELVSTPYRFGGSKKKAKDFFEEGLKQAFSQMRAATNPNYSVTIFYAFKQQEEETTKGRLEKYKVLQ
jgi:adenine-specific DNA methylase/very-short-patch-repair endonuclease